MSLDSGASPPALDEGLDEDLDERLDELLLEALAAGLGSAAAVSVGDAGAEVCRAVRGHQRRVPTLGAAIDEEWEFDLASLTKPMVSATLAMLLAEREPGALEQPVRRWLPDAATPATLAQLLGHTAGCAAHVKFYEHLGEARRPDETPRQALLRLARTTALTGLPGHDTAYSDLGYLQLGELLERAGGARLDELFAAELAGPLGLRCRYRPIAAPADGPDDGPVDGPRHDDRCVATELDERGAPLCGQVHDENARAGGGVFGHAGLFGTIGDVARFAQIMLSLVDERAATEWPRLISAATARRFFALAPGGASWRLGWDTPSSTPGLSHAGDLWPRDTGVGHLGFTGTSLWLDLARGRWVALLTNRVHPSREGSADGIKRLRRAVMDAAWRGLEAR